jgi:hypothetical protein
MSPHPIHFQILLGLESTSLHSVDFVTMALESISTHHFEFITQSVIHTYTFSMASSLNIPCIPVYKLTSNLVILLDCVIVVKVNHHSCSI